MDIEGMVNRIIHPHAAMLGGIIGAHGARIQNRLEDIHGAISNLGRPDFDDKWQYNQFSFTGAGGPVDFATPIVIPNDEVWLAQVLIVETATSIVIATDGGQLRGSFTTTGPNTLSLSGNIALLPGEHIVVSSTAAATGTLAVIRKQMSQAMQPRQAIGPQGNEMVSGRSNTHDPVRDNLSQKGIRGTEGREVRAGEGLERSTEPAIPYTEARETTLVLDPTAP